MFIASALNTLKYVALGIEGPALDIRTIPYSTKAWNQSYVGSTALSMDISTDDKYIVLTDEDKVIIYVEDNFTQPATCDLNSQVKKGNTCIDCLLST